MASLRNAVKRKTHKERSQPASRKKFGLLEKKSDYKLRARDYRRKQGRLRLLKKKAEYRNPDEFYFSMVNSKTNDGIHKLNDRDNLATVETDVKQLMRTQDAAYVQTKLNQETRKIEKLNKTLHFLNSGRSSSNKHTIFFDKDEDIEKFSASEYFDTVEELKNRTYNRPRKATLSKTTVRGGTVKSIIESNAEEEDPVLLKRQMKKLKKKRKRAYNELNARIEREEKLQATVNHLELRKQLHAGGRRRKVKEGDGNQPAVYRWKRERKR